MSIPCFSYQLSLIPRAIPERFHSDLDSPFPVTMGCITSILSSTCVVYIVFEAQEEWCFSADFFPPIAICQPGSHLGSFSLSYHARSVSLFSQSLPMHFPPSPNAVVLTPFSCHDTSIFRYSFFSSPPSKIFQEVLVSVQLLLDGYLSFT